MLTCSGFSEHLHLNTLYLQTWWNMNIKVENINLNSANWNASLWMVILSFCYDGEIKWCSSLSNSAFWIFIIYIYIFPLWVFALNFFILFYQQKAQVFILLDNTTSNLGVFSCHITYNSKITIMILN